MRFHPCPDTPAGWHLTEIATLCTKTDVYPSDNCSGPGGDPGLTFEQLA